MTVERYGICEKCRAVGKKCFNLGFGMRGKSPMADGVVKFFLYVVEEVVRSIFVHESMGGRGHPRRRPRVKKLIFDML